MTFIDRLLARLATSPPLFLQHWGYPFLFGLVFLEGIPFLGLVIPGHTATILAGFLAKLGVLDLWAVLLFVFLGMLLGDIVAYELGRRWGHAFIVRYGTRFHFREKEYRRVRSLLRNHPGKTIIIGKFQMLTRLFGPFVAGATEVNRGLFNLLNTIAALLWTICFVLIGYLFGQGFQAAERVIGTFALLALIFLLLLAGGYRRVERFVQRHQHMILHHPVSTLAAAGASLFAFAAIMDNLSDQGFLLRLDLAVHAAVPALRTWLLTALSLVINVLFDWVALTAIAIFVFALLLWMRRRRSAAIFATSMLLSFAVEEGLKALLFRYRPAGAMIVEASGSFPSGHATMAAVFCLFLIWEFRGDFTRVASRWLFLASMTLLPIVVGLSRVYLGIHWLSDVLAGWALGIFMLAAVLLGFHVFRK